MVPEDNSKFIRCCLKKKELKICRELIEVLETFNKKHKSVKKIWVEPGVRLPLGDSCFLKEVISASPKTLKDWSRTLNIALPGYGTKKDLEKGHYEGGCKVWEATADLVKFISEDEQFIGKLLSDNKKLKVLELGCGSGLVTLAFISRLLSHDKFNSDYRIHLQDYNWDVLATLTLLNFNLNLPLDYLTALFETKCLKFLFGDWRDFTSENKVHHYDLIMTCETIYDSQSYESLHNVFDKHLSSDGIIVLATKDTYFGLSGGLYSWLDYVEQRNTFASIRMVQVFQTGIPRSIIVLRRSLPV